MSVAAPIPPPPLAALRQTWTVLDEQFDTVYERLAGPERAQYRQQHAAARSAYLQGLAQALERTAHPQLVDDIVADLSQAQQILESAIHEGAKAEKILAAVANAVRLAGALVTFARAG